jgi:hypothetical protein
LTAAEAANEIASKDGVFLKPTPILRNYLQGQKNKKRICIFGGLFAYGSFYVCSFFPPVRDSQKQGSGVRD